MPPKLSLRGGWVAVGEFGLLGSYWVSLPTTSETIAWFPGFISSLADTPSMNLYFCRSFNLTMSPWIHNKSQDHGPASCVSQNQPPTSLRPKFTQPFPPKLAGIGIIQCLNQNPEQNIASKLFLPHDLSYWVVGEPQKLHIHTNTIFTQYCNPHETKRY